MDIEVRFWPSGTSHRTSPGVSLLEAARAAGLPIASACGADGVCGHCGVTIVAGAESLSRETEAETRLKRLNRVDPSLRLACRAVVSGDVEVRATYW